MISRNKKLITAAMILIAAFLVQGASAITIDSFDMSISENGNTELVFDYSLSAMEKFAVFMFLCRIGDLHEDRRSGRGTPKGDR